MVGGLAILNLERFSFLTVTSPISQILGIAKGFNVLYYSRNSRRLLGFFFFLARLLLAVTSASVATVFFFFFLVYLFGDINNILSYTDLT